MTSSHNAWRMPRKNQNFSEQLNRNPRRVVEAREGSDLCDWKEQGWVVASGRDGSRAHTVPSGFDLSLPLPPLLSRLCFSVLASSQTDFLQDRASGGSRLTLS